MASFILSRSLLVLLLVIALVSRISISEPNSSFSFTSSSKNASFESDDIALYGEAKLVYGGSSIQLTNTVSHGGGLVVYRKPIESVDTKSVYFSGFSTVFSFSMSPGRGGRLGFVVFPANGTLDHSLFEVQFDTSDSNVAVIVDGATVSKKIRNFTITNLGNEKELLLFAWINYIASGKFLEVWLSKSESFKSVDPSMFTRIDLYEMLKGKSEFMSEMMKYEGEFVVGVKSFSGNFNLHSWSLEARRVPKSVHSYAALLEAKRRDEEEAKRRRRGRMWEIVTCFVMTFGSTGLVFFAMMHIWAAFKRNNLVMVMQEECGIKTKEFEYEKMEKMEVGMSHADKKQERK